MLTRRQFLKLSAASIAGLALPLRWSFDAPVAFASYNTPTSAAITKYTQPLRGVGAGGIPVALPDAAPAPVTGAAHYSLRIGQYTDTIHPALGPTTLWGYSPAAALGEGAFPTRHLGGIIVAQKGVPIQLTFTNQLPAQHMLPVDVHNDAGAMTGLFPEAADKYGGTGINAACTHLHGGHVPWISDGGPMAWFTPASTGGKYGPSIANATTNHYKLLNPNLQPGQAEYYYPNSQSARMMWYHDHAHDITRLNAYAGIATAYLLRDSFEGNLRTMGLPDFVENGGREIPLVIQDKVIVGSDLATQDPSWPSSCPNSPGSLWYPHVYDAPLGPGGMPLGTDTSAVPEMFGDTMLANGTAYPYATVEARRYRLRILNACNSRFLNLQLYVEDNSGDSITLDSFHNPTNTKGPDFLVIGTEGGFLSKPVLVPSNVPFNPSTLGGSLITAPAERWDVIVDFSGYAGKSVVLYNDAPAPFPMGDDSNDYFLGNSSNSTTMQAGRGPNTRQIMRFDVIAATSSDPPMGIGPTTNLTAGIDPSLVGMWTTNALPVPPGVPVRVLTLNEDYDDYGRLIQRLGSDQELFPGTFGRNYMDASTENPSIRSTEVWQIANLSADTHPVHFHLVNVQLLSRRPFDSAHFGGVPIYTGAARGPGATELGWKETVKMHPGEVTTVIMKFDMPSLPKMATPKSLSPSLGAAGWEYVWHCHILEHEEHDMMRPLVVTGTEFTSYFPQVGR